MIIGIPKETKAGENRVAATPAGVEILTRVGHQVLLETGAGAASGFEDPAYAAAGARIAESGKAVFDGAEMIWRVKEPQPAEFALIRRGQVYFSYLHLAAAPSVARALTETGGVFIGYETIQRDDGSLPLLTPMSEVAGPMAVQVGAKYLEMAQGGHGVLLGGVPGVDPGSVLVLGAGKVGLGAARMASGLGARVYLLDIDLDRLRHLSDIVPENCFLIMSSPAAIRQLLPKADVVVGAALIPGSRTPTLVTRNMLAGMKRGAVVVDVAIDQGGCFETSRETTHADPIFTVDGIVHYAVSNMPGALPRTSTIALTNATLPYAIQIAEKGWKQAMQKNPDIRRGANVVLGKTTHKAVADVLELIHTPIDSLLER
jgi:alanine dehydrogenase